MTCFCFWFVWIVLLLQGLIQSSSEAGGESSDAGSVRYREPQRSFQRHSVGFESAPGGLFQLIRNLQSDTFDFFLFFSSPLQPDLLVTEHPVKCAQSTGLAWFCFRDQQCCRDAFLEGNGHPPYTHRATNFLPCWIYNLVYASMDTLYGLQLKS